LLAFRHGSDYTLLCRYMHILLHLKTY
jgi:hypothetical protein